jgi:hypothetical protein
VNSKFPVELEKFLLEYGSGYFKGRCEFPVENVQYLSKKITFILHVVNLLVHYTTHGTRNH